MTPPPLLPPLSPAPPSFNFFIIFFPEGGSNFGEGTTRGEGGKRNNNFLLLDIVGDGEEDVDFIIDDLILSAVEVDVDIGGQGGQGGGGEETRPTAEGRIIGVLSITTAL
jgi:hypothetical protein